jgi:hypothetical protein
MPPSCSRCRLWLILASLHHLLLFLIHLHDAHEALAWLGQLLILIGS